MAEESGDAKGRVVYSGTWKLEGTKGVALKVISTIELLVTLSGMNQSELATAMGIGEGTLSEYLSGKRAVGPTGIRQFAKALKVSPEVLAKGEGLSLENLRDDVVSRLEKQVKADKLSEPVVSPSAYDTQVQVASHDVPEPDYTAARMNRLRVIRSIAYEGSDAVTLTIAPLRLAASPPEELDPSAEGTVSIPADEAEVRNAPIFPVKVFGTSMNNVIEPGEIVFYRRSRHPAKNAIVIARVRGGVTMKRLRGKKLYPDSTDEHETIDPLEDDGLIGEVVAVHKPKKT